MFTLNSSKEGEPLMLHDEPIYLDDKIIGEQHLVIIHLILIKIFHLDMSVPNMIWKI